MTNIQKHDTKYKKAIPMHIQVCCALYKLVQGANFLVLVVSILQWKNWLCLLLYTNSSMWSILFTKVWHLNLKVLPWSLLWNNAKSGVVFLSCKVLSMELIYPS
jgi:hypothetical protein